VGSRAMNIWVKLEWESYFKKEGFIIA